MNSEQILNTASQVLKRVQSYGAIRIVNGKLRIESTRPLPDELIKRIRQFRGELVALLQSQRGIITYGHCKLRNCEHFIDHRANPRCLHPLCTKNGKHPAGLWLYMLVECPADTNRLRWYVPKVSHDHGGTLPEHIHARDGQTPELINEIKRQKPEIIKALQRPHIDRRGILVIPLECDDKYKWWAGGQSVQKTLKEIGAPPDVVAKYTNSGTA